MQLEKLSEQAKQLKLGGITISNSLRYGMFSSLFVGQGIDFDHCREYEINDDVRYIDWNLTARTGHPYVKLYAEEHDINIFVIVDASDSMSATVKSKKSVSYFEKAFEVAALFLFAGLHLNCQLGGIIFADKIKNIWLPKQGEEFAFSILHDIKKVNIKENAKSNLTDALKLCYRILIKRSLIIVISDFKINDYEKKLSLLTKNHDVIAIKIYSQNDYQLASLGLLEFYDSENEQTFFINTSSKKEKHNFETKFLKDIFNWNNSCIDIGVLPLKISMDSNATKEVASFLMSAKNKYEAISAFKKNQQR